MEKLSVVIITYNEEKNIGRCIDSVQNIADEVVVLDSFSTDRTKEICQEKGARFFQQAFLGFVDQKNKALQFAENNYVLCLDADEAIDNKLEESILNEKKNFSYKGYIMNRCTNYCGKFIRHGSWYPDRKMHLFDKREAKWGGMDPHARVEFEKKHETKRLKGDILHYSDYSMVEHTKLNDHYSTVAAETYFRKGKRSNVFKMTLNPAWAFINGYFFRLGFLDGYYGFVIAKMVAQLTFLKYKKLYTLQKNKHPKGH
jgi:glycosyltransferase involved in cell wall biosynthesis